MEYGDISDDKLVLGVSLLMAISTLISLAEVREKHKILIHFVV